MKLLLSMIGGKVWCYYMKPVKPHEWANSPAPRKAHDWSMNNCLIYFEKFVSMWGYLALKNSNTAVSYFFSIFHVCSVYNNPQEFLTSAKKVKNDQNYKDYKLGCIRLTGRLSCLVWLWRKLTITFPVPTDC